MDDTLERLENRCNRFVKGSKKYKEGINVLSQSQTSFADFLEEFCGGTDEESMMLGVLTSVLLSRPMIAAHHISLVQTCGAAVGSLIELVIMSCFVNQNLQLVRGTADIMGICLDTGGGMMSKFVGVFRELASFNELLHTQVELILVERLQRNWLKVVTITCCCTGLSYSHQGIQT